MNPNITIYESIYATKEPRTIPVEKALARIRDGRSRIKVDEIRATLDKAKADALKKSLPAVSFAGTFAQRGDKNLQSHSGLMILDFDKLTDVGEKMAQMAQYPHTYAAWVSPSGNGVKALICIADPSKHREHFDAIKETFQDVDPSGANEERLCFESYDPHIYINAAATPFTGLLKVEKVKEKVDAGADANERFARVQKWMANQPGAFAAGNRDNYIFKTASACCRAGIDVSNAENLISFAYPASNDFTAKELLRAVRSGYKASNSKSDTWAFEKDTWVDKKTRKNVKLEELADLDPNTRPRDVIYSADVKRQALALYDVGFEAVKGIGVPVYDKHFKRKRGEITCRTGIGNAGKSALYKWETLMRVLLHGEKFATFAPEDNPPEEYYMDFVEMLMGCDCTPANPNRPPRWQYEAAYDWVGQHIFYLQPQDAAPTPDYVKERFLELVIKEKVDGVCIDPWNQMSHDYTARTDQYLEAILGDLSRWAQSVNVYFDIIAHPKGLTKMSNGNYSCADVGDLAGGSMWSNKADNILSYYRPMMQTEPNDPTCELHSKKIRRQKTVGKRGFFSFRYVRTLRRFQFDEDDPMERVLQSMSLPFQSHKRHEEPQWQNPSAGITPQRITPYNGPVQHWQEPRNEPADDHWNDE